MIEAIEGMLASPRSASGRRGRALTFLAAMAVLAFVSLACTLEEGERAMGEGSCPSGETCSEATPQGLTFLGVSLRDNAESGTGLLPTAVGGRQEISYLVSGDGLLGEVRVENNSPEVVDFVDHEQLSEAQGQLVAVATRQGSSTLRLVDADGALYDRVAVRAEPIAVVTLVARDIGGSEVRTWIRPGERQEVVARLFDAEDNRLVDTSLTLTAHDLAGEATGDDGARTTWDGLSFLAPSDAAEVSFTIHAGGRDYALSLPIEAE